MRDARHVSLIWTIAAILVVALVVAQPARAEEEGSGAETSYDGLVRFEGSVMDEAWLRPDIDLSGFNKVIFEPVTVTYRRPPRRAPARASTGTGNFALTDRQMNELKTIFQESFEEAISGNDGWEVAEAPGPDVLGIGAQLIDLVVTVPTRDMGRSEFFVSEFGEVTLVGELLDSETGQVLARGVDRRRIGQSHGGRLFRATSVGARRDVQQLFTAWATLIRERLDQIREVTSAAAPAAEEAADGGR